MHLSVGISLPSLVRIFHSKEDIIFFSYSLKPRMSDGVWQAFLCVPKDGGKWQGEAHSRCHFSGLQAGADSEVPSEKPRWHAGVSSCQEERKRLNSQGYLSPHGRKVFRVWHTHRRLYSGIRAITSFYLGRESYGNRIFFISSWCWTAVLPSPRSRKHMWAHTHMHVIPSVGIWNRQQRHPFSLHWFLTFFFFLMHFSPVTGGEMSSLWVGEGWDLKIFM